MSETLASLILPSIVAAIAAPVGAWLGNVAQRSRYRAEIDTLRAEIDGKLSANRANELDNVRKASDILMDNIVAPLKLEIETLRKDVEKFRHAVEQIHACDYAASCPVSRSLRLAESGAKHNFLSVRKERQQPDEAAD